MKEGKVEGLQIEGPQMGGAQMGGAQMGGAQMGGLQHYIPSDWEIQQMHWEIERQKGWLELAKSEEKYKQRLAYENASQNIRTYAEVSRKLLGKEVFQSAEGFLVLIVTEPGGREIRSRKLLNIRDYSARLLISTSPKKAVLEVRWSNGSGDKVIFFDAEGISAETFRRCLRDNGALFLVSGRMEKTATEALLAYTFQNASQVDIPFYHGWTRDATGKWHYADEDELTMQEVLENV